MNLEIITILDSSGSMAILRADGSMNTLATTLRTAP
jgi:hypothetical protein